MKTVRLTTAQAIVRYLIAQRIEIDGELRPLFPGVFAIFGHGNVTCLGHALEEAKDDLPTWRGQNEQGMALAAVAYAKAMRRRQIMVATSSIGPGATNMVTAAAVAHANRLPVLLLSGDTFASRIPDPVLQQVEGFGDPSVTVNDTFKPVTRYWDRIVKPVQVVHTLPHAVATMLDPATCGPAFLGPAPGRPGRGLRLPRPLLRHGGPRDPAAPSGRGPAGAGGRRAGRGHEAAHRRRRRRPLLPGGGGAAGLRRTAQHPGRRDGGRQGHAAVRPPPERRADRLDRVHVGQRVWPAEADVVLAVGSRLQDFTTGSWTVFANESVRFIGLNTAAFDAVKHLAHPLVADAREGLRELSARVGAWRAPDDWTDRAAVETAQYHAYVDKIASPSAPAQEEKPTYAQVVGAVDRLALPTDYAFAAAGGFPGELNSGWRAKGLDSIDMEYGYSCMGYEISGAWGAKMALPDREVIVFVGDGSYLMMNSDLYSSVLSGHKLIVIVCDNGGFAVINRLQVNQGGAPFNNLIADSKVQEVVAVDFAAHAAAMGCRSEKVGSVAELEAAMQTGAGLGPDLRDRHRHIGLRLDGRRIVLGGRGARGQRPAVRGGGPGGHGRRQGRAAGGLVSGMEETMVDSDPAGLAGKVVVVTGGTQGLGQAVARLAAARGAAGVAVVGRDTAKGQDAVDELEAMGTDGVFVPVDLADPDVGDHVMAAVDERFGVVHGLVNAAAETRSGRGVGHHDGAVRPNAGRQRPGPVLPPAGGRPDHEAGRGGWFRRQHRQRHRVRRPGPPHAVRHLQGRAAHADPQRRLLADVGPRTGQPREPGVDGHAQRAHRPTGGPRAGARTGWSRPRRPSPSDASSSRRRRPAPSASCCPTSRGS